MWRVEKFMSKEHMNKYDEEFVSLVHKDIDGFLKQSNGRCVLIFPSLDNRRRYLIHKIGELLSIKTFSVGEGKRRVTVACNFLIIGKERFSVENIDASDTDRVMDTKIENKGAVSKSKRIIRPDAPLYIPPAVRRALQSEKNKSALEKVKCSAVSKQESHIKDTSSSSYAPSISKENDSSTLAKSDSRTTNLATRMSLELKINETCHSIIEYSEHIVEKEKCPSLPDTDSSCSNIAKLTVPDSSVITKSPEAYECLEEFETNTNTNTNSNFAISTETEKPTTISIINKNGSDHVHSECSKSNENLYTKNELITISNEPAMKNQLKTSEKRLWLDKNNDSDEQELVRASEEINRRNKRIIKQSFTKSDVLIISETNTENESEVHCKNTDVSTVDCWEDLLDENGKIDQDILLEITQHVGDVSISKAKEDYKDYKNKVSAEDYSHVIEIYDFPKEFQTRDLISIFETFKCGNFHIKWVDDNHALGIFSSGFAANEVLTMKHPLLKLRPFCEASKQSIFKAKRYPNALMPFAVRPQTCPQTARRMVSGALGLKLNNAKEERAKEIKILKEAREKKKLAAKQEDDAWEGKS